MTVSRVTLADEPLTNLQNIKWGLSEGTSPMKGTVFVTIDQAKRILATARQKAKSKNPFVALKFEADTSNGRKVVTYSNIYITGYSPSDYEPLNFVQLHMVDNRFFWTRGSIDARFNIRTEVGDLESVKKVFINSLGTVPPETYRTVSYRSYSLYPPIRSGTDPTPISQTYWKLSEIVKEILSGDHPQSFKKQFPDADIQINLGDLISTDSQRFEEIHVRGNHKQALDTILDLVPHIGIYVDYNGVVKFYNKTSGNESELIQQLNAPFTSNTVPRYVRNDLICPKRIIVQFDSDVEIRFNYEDKGQVGGTSTPDGLESRSLVNVMPVPDIALDVSTKMADGSTNTIRAYQGQFLPFDDVLRALQTRYGSALMSHTDIMNTYLTPSFINNIAWRIKAVAANAPADKIAQELKASWRRKFRINGNWQAKMINIRDRRVTVFDPTTGTSAPSPIYQDYAVWYTDKAVLSFVNSGGTGFNMYQNVETWSSTNTNYIIENRGDAPAIGNAGNSASVVQVPYFKLALSDPENGIFEVNLQAFDPSGFIKAIYPSKITNAPTWNYSDPTKPFYVDEKRNGVYTFLDPNHYMATIISASPAPNVASVFYQEVIEPKDLLANSVSLSKLVNPVGPDMYIKIPPTNNQMIRIKWTDDQSSNIERLFGIGFTQPVFPDELKDNIVNREQIKELAVAVATSIYAKYVDRFKGSKTSELAQIELGGSIDNIYQQISVEGEPSTTIMIQEDLITPSAENMLSPATKAFIYKQVTKGL